MKSKLNKYITVLAATMAILPLAASASTWSTSAQYGEYNFGNGYTVNNDVWSSSAQSQTLYVDTTSGSAPHFWATTTQTGGGIKSYPHMNKTINKSVTSLSSLTGNFNSGGANGQYDFAFDCWIPTEVMVWTKWSSGVGPWGSLYQSNVSIGGVTYNVYKPGGPWSFLRTSQTSSGSANLAAIFKWLVNGGHLSNGTVGKCQYGVEITSGSGTWTINSCSIK